MVTRKQLAKGVARKARAAARLGERDKSPLGSPSRMK